MINDFLSSRKIDNKIRIIPVLGSALDKYLIERVFKKYNVDIVFHAAGYKHVPLVQINPLQGIYNNIFSTIILCKAAEKCSVKKLLLISTDKAVRPTNFMGA